MRFFLLLITAITSLQVTAQWQLVGNKKFTDNYYSNIRIVATANGVFVAHNEQVGPQNKASVRKWDGSNWSYVGNPGFSPGVISGLTMDVDAKGTPYVAFIDQSAGSKATVMKYDGTNWVFVGAQGFTENTIREPVLKIDNDIPYLLFQDRLNATGKATMLRFNGTGWQPVGNPRFSSGNAWDTELVFKSGMPYVSFRNFIDGNNNKIVVMRYDGSNWVSVGTPDISANVPSATSGESSLAFHPVTGVPYIAFIEKSVFPSFLSIKKFEGGSWQTVGEIKNTIFSNYFFSIGGTPRLVFYKNQPTVFFRGVDQDLFAQTQVGNTWQFLDNNQPISDSGTQSLDASVYNDTIYTVYNDEYFKQNGIDGRLTVKRFFQSGVLSSGELQLKGWRNEGELKLHCNGIPAGITGYFSIEAAAGNMKFSEISKLPSSVAMNSAAFEWKVADSKDYADNFYFRVRLKTNNGKVMTSNTVRLASPYKNIDVSVGPNPFTSSIILNIKSGLEERTVVQLHDQQGRKIYDATYLVNKGSNQIKVSLPTNLPAGIFLVNIVGNSPALVYVTKLLKQ